MRLIAVNGRIGSGKDETFLIIKRWGEERGLRVERRAFADLLKLSAMRLFKPDATLEEALEFANMFKFDGELHLMLDGRLRAVVNGREFYQRYGTESHRDVFDPHFWVNALIPLQNGRTARNFNDAHIGVITDLRFPNEAGRVDMLGGEVWRINADARLGPPSDGHVSEQALDSTLIHREIDNNGSLADFTMAIEIAVEDFYSNGRRIRT